MLDTQKIIQGLVLNITKNNAESYKTLLLILIYQILILWVSKNGGKGEIYARYDNLESNTLVGNSVPWILQGWEIINNWISN